MLLKAVAQGSGGTDDKEALNRAVSHSPLSQNIM